MMPKLWIKHDDFLTALRPVVKQIPSGDVSHAVLSFQKETLEIGLIGMTCGVPARGHWPGQARVGASFVRSLLSPPPTEDPVCIRVEEGRLHVGNFSTKCKWDGSPARVIELPMGPPLYMILQLPFRYSREHIEISGLTKVLEEAETKRNELMDQAVQILAPLLVTVADVRRLVDKRIKGDVAEDLAEDGQ
jgi:hypothetical protein